MIPEKNFKSLSIEVNTPSATVAPEDTTPASGQPRKSSLDLPGETTVTSPQSAHAHSGSLKRVGSVASTDEHHPHDTPTGKEAAEHLHHDVENKSILSVLRKFINQDVDSLRLPVPLAIIEPVSNLQFLADLEQLECFAALTDLPWESPQKGASPVHSRASSKAGSVTSKVSFRSKRNKAKDENPIKWRQDAEVVRFLAVLKVVFAVLKRGVKKIKKPLNPIKGELFYCNFVSDPSKESSNPEESADTRVNASRRPRISLVAEQVSHHPPISAFYVTDEERRASATLMYDVHAKFTGTHFALQSHSTCRIKLVRPTKPNFLTPEGVSPVDDRASTSSVATGQGDDEEYEFDFPDAYASGILSLIFKLVWTGTCSLKCPRTQLQADLTFKEKKWWSPRDSYDVEVVVTKGHDVVAELEGTWNDEVYIQYSDEKDNELFYSASDPSSYEQQLPPPSACDASLFSSIVWKDVVDNMHAGETSAASRAKHQVEQRQRQLEKERKAGGQEWEPTYFEHVEGGYRWKYITGALDFKTVPSSK